MNDYPAAAEKVVSNEGWSRMGSLAQRLGQRTKILLLADGLTPKDVSHQLQISPPVVFKWRKRYLEVGLEGLNDLSRSGQPRKLSTQKMKEILTLARHSKESSEAEPIHCVDPTS